MHDIAVRSPLYRYGDHIINLNFAQHIDLSNGTITMCGGCIFNVPPDIVKAWTNEFFDYKKIEGRV